MGFVCRGDGATSGHCAGQRGGWLEHPFGINASSAPQMHIWLVQHEVLEKPPRELGKAELGLMAPYKATFWPAAYHVCDHWHI